MMEKKDMPLAQFSRDDRLVSALESLFADQSKQLTALVQQVAQQSAQVSMLITQQTDIRTDIQKRWGELPIQYIPRAEHNAMGLDKRVADIERDYTNLMKEIFDLKLTLQKQIQDGFVEAAKNVVAAELLAKEDLANQKSEISNRSFAFIVLGCSTVINVMVILFTHFFLR